MIVDYEHRLLYASLTGKKRSITLRLQPSRVSLFMERGMHDAAHGRRGEGQGDATREEDHNPKC